MQTSAFRDRMAALDEVVAKCLDEEPFKGRVVRDTSNRTGRDWPWWGIQVEETQRDGSDSRRVSAEITLASTIDLGIGAYQEAWRAQAWIGVGGNTFSKHEKRELPWDVPTPEVLQATISGLLAEAKAELPGWGAD